MAQEGVLEKTDDVFKNSHRGASSFPRYRALGEDRPDLHTVQDSLALLKSYQGFQTEVRGAYLPCQR